MRVKAYNIKYDTDGNGQTAKRLPKRVTVDLDDDDADVSLEIADAVSNATGFCIFGCEFVILQKC